MLSQVTGTNTGNRSYTYDPAGNVLSDSYREMQSTNYGRGNLPYQVTMVNASVHYLYNSANTRIYKKDVPSGGSATREFYLRNAMGKEMGILNEVDNTWEWFSMGANRLARIVPEVDQQPASLTPVATPLYPAYEYMSNLAFNGVHYYLYDHLGNTRINYQPIVKCIAGSAPIITFQLNSVHDYYPYGKELRKFIDIKERYLSTQHERDAETGLDYRGARYYDSDLGSFLSLDPMAVSYPSNSSYSYVLSNPVKFLDSDGKVVRDENGNIIYVSTGENFPLSNGGPTVTAEVGYIFADDGTPIIVLKNLTSDIRFDDNCHGVSFLKPEDGGANAAGGYWLDNTQVEALLTGDGYELVPDVSNVKKGDIVVYDDDKGDNAHSMTVTELSATKEDITVHGLGGMQIYTYEQRLEDGWDVGSTGSPDIYTKNTDDTVKSGKEKKMFVTQELSRANSNRLQRMAAAAGQGLEMKRDQVLNVH